MLTNPEASSTPEIEQKIPPKKSHTQKKKSTKSTKKKKKLGRKRSTERVGEGCELVMEEENGGDDGEDEEGEDEVSPAFHARRRHRRR